MNEDIEEAFKAIAKTLERWYDDSEPRTYTLALQLETQMTILKFLVGGRFDELPTFNRALKEATAFIDEHDKKKAEVKQ